MIDLKWTREPAEYSITDEKITITTEPHTDLWQRTYYHFRNDNAPVLQMDTEEKFFSFIVKTDFPGIKKIVMETRTIEVDGKTYKKPKKEWENRPYSIEEMMFNDDLFDGD